MKKVVLFSLIIMAVGIKATSQGLVGLPGQATQIAQGSVEISQQATMISKAIEGLRVAQQTYSTIQNQDQQLQQIKTFMANQEQNLKQLGNMKNLKLNDILNLADKVFCLKNTNSFPTQLKFLNIISLITGAYGKCAPGDVTKLTWNGMTQNFDKQMEAQGKNMRDFYLQFADPKEYWAEHNKVMQRVDTARTMQNVTSATNKNSQVAIALKYKELSDELFKTATELSQALNQEGDNAIQMDKGQRLMLQAQAQEFMLKAAEYEEKYNQLMMLASEPGSADQQIMSTYYRAHADNQILNFIN